MLVYLFLMWLHAGNDRSCERYIDGMWFMFDINGWRREDEFVQLVEKGKEHDEQNCGYGWKL